MSNKTIHELDSLSEIAQNDEMLIYDISAGADNPTKKVTAGNILNYVKDNSKDVYSNDEVKTNKVWIDGKPIYRRVFTVTNTASTEITMGTIPSYDWIVNARVVAKISTNDDIITDGYGSGNLGVVIKGNGNVIVYNVYDRAKITAYVEYTKPTD